jgi:hypothetical protein
MPWYVAWAPTPWNDRLGCIYSPQHKTSRWRKVVALCVTPDSALFSAPSRWSDTIGDRWRAGFLQRKLWTSHQKVWWSSLHSATWN